MDSEKKRRTGRAVGSYQGPILNPYYKRVMSDEIGVASWDGEGASPVDRALSIARVLEIVLSSASEAVSLSDLESVFPGAGRSTIKMALGVLQYQQSVERARGGVRLAPELAELVQLIDRFSTLERDHGHVPRRR